MGSKIVPILAKVVFAASTCYATLLIVLLIDYWANTSAYRFGTEVHSWKYASAERYVGSLLLQLFMVGSSLFVGIKCLWRFRIVVAQAAIFISAVAMGIWL